MLNLRVRNLLRKFMIGKQILIIVTATDAFIISSKIKLCFFWSFNISNPRKCGYKILVKQIILPILFSLFQNYSLI